MPRTGWRKPLLSGKDVYKRQIVEMEKQEGTHLTKCVVDCGDYGHDIRISTGAANMKVGDCVPGTVPGSTTNICFPSFQ